MPVPGERSVFRKRILRFVDNESADLLALFEFVDLDGRAAQRPVSVTLHYGTSM